MYDSRNNHVYMLHTLVWLQSLREPPTPTPFPSLLAGGSNDRPLATNQRLAPFPAHASVEGEERIILSANSFLPIDGTRRVATLQSPHSGCR